MPNLPFPFPVKCAIIELVTNGKKVLGEVFMINSIQLQGLTYLRSLPGQATVNTVDGEDFDSVLEEEINAADNTDETSMVTYTNPEDLVCVDAPSSLETYFQEASDTYGVPVALIKAVAKAESNFNSQAVSGAGAQGIMQLMPATAQGLGVSNAFDAKENIMGGTKYLAQMLTKYNGSVKLALAAYNAGSGNVDKYEGVPPFSETQNYIKKIFGYLGMDSTKSAESTSSAGKDENAVEKTTTGTATQTTAQSGGLSSEDITKLADAILTGISSSSTSATAADLYSQLYNQSSGSNILGNYSSIISNLFHS